MKKRIYLVLGLVVVLSAVIWWYNSSRTTDELQLTTIAKRGTFTSLVTTSGELRAKKSTQIRGPREARRYRVNEMKIQDLVAEGKHVKEGEYIGRLDPSQLHNSRKDLEAELDKSESQLIQTKLDTALELRAKRDELRNQKYAVEERELELKYSEFEPPAIQRQAQIALDKAKRAYKNGLESYVLKRRQAVARVREVNSSRVIQQTNIDEIDKVMQKFTIIAPQSGMLIYARDWSGRKKTVGSTISSWNPVIAELPDLSTMISRTYVNEVDISKVKVGQEVEIGIDAFPDKIFPGKVDYVANVGETKNGMVGKAFEVVIQLEKTDSILRPGMTTSNKVNIYEQEDAVYVPLECLHATDDIYFVVKQSGLSLIKQEVIIGEKNENDVIIIEGVNEGDELLLSLPDKLEEKEISRL